MYGIPYDFQGGFKVKLAAAAKQLIEQSGLNTKVFAEKAGLPYTTLRSMLDRGFGRSAVENVIKVCKALGITVEELEAIANGEAYEHETIAAHHDGEEWSEEELDEIEAFKKFVRSKRSEN